MNRTDDRAYGEPDERPGINIERSKGLQPFPPQFDPLRYPAGTICRVTARRTHLQATYESNGACWKRIDPNAARRSPE